MTHRTVEADPTCRDCRDIERNHPRLLWTVQQHEDAAEMFVATFRGGK